MSTTQTFNNGEWTPTKRAPLNGKGGAGAKEKAATPITLTVDLSTDIAGALKEIVDGQTKTAEAMASVTEALKAHTTQMEAMFKRLDRVMSAPRSVTLKRDADGFAQSAISEPLVSKAKG